jgi:signal transduction histidine kinase
VYSGGDPGAGVSARDGRATSLVGRQGDTVAAIWHDPALNTDPELVNAASQAVLLALENGRLEAELADSRERIAAAGAAERRRVERDLHDGAQQQLVALQIKVALARELAPTDSDVATRLADVGYGLEDVLSELREYAHGAAPPLLRDAGLRTALGAAAQRSVPPVAFAADGIARYPEEIETAVYFCCLEALQNVRKHAGPGAHAEIRLSEHAGKLCFDVVDDGVGCELESRRGAGIGLSNMSERVAALHGRLDVDSAAGRGTSVRGRIPLASPR